MVFFPTSCEQIVFFQIVDMVTLTLNLDGPAVSRLLCLLGHTNILMSNGSRNSISVTQRTTPSLISHH